MIWRFKVIINIEWYGIVDYYWKTMEDLFPSWEIH